MGQISKANTGFLCISKQRRTRSCLIWGKVTCCLAMPSVWGWIFRRWTLRSCPTAIMTTEAFRTVNTRAPLYVSRYAFGAFYSEKYIGLSPKVKEDPHLIETDGVLSLDRNITLYADAAVPLSAEQSRNLSKEVEGVRLPDDFLHEQYLLVEEQRGRILFSGCSHRGVLSIARHFAPDVLVGGFHFKNVSDEAFLQQAAENLLEVPALYYTCHCTGYAQYTLMKRKMGDRLQYLSCGQSIVI